MAIIDIAKGASKLIYLTRKPRSGILLIYQLPIKQVFKKQKV
jgi:hypothetical protein